MDARLAHAAKHINKLSPNNLLDIGCRSCELQELISKDIAYDGCDLFQNNKNSVKYVNDIMRLSLQNKYACVVALDVIEHVDNPYELMDKIFETSNSYVVASLPNIYSMTHKMDFMLNSTLGKKYKFGTQNSLDRHRWLMNCKEAIAFFGYYSEKYNKKLTIQKLSIKDSCTNNFAKFRTNIASTVLSNDTMTRTILAVYE